MLSLAASLLLFKFVLLAGLALWLTVVSINNFTAFAGGVAAIGRLMGMQSFDEAPAIQSPLLSRRVHNAFWHRLIYTIVLTIEVIVAILLWFAAIGFAGAMLGSTAPAEAAMCANLALAALLGMSFVLALGGAWFAYYIRLEGMQLMHFVLIVVAIASAVVVNLPA